MLQSGPYANGIAANIPRQGRIPLDGIFHRTQDSRMDEKQARTAQTFPDEPIGGEAAIGWHLRQQDWHDCQETMADAMDMAGAADHHRDLRLAHKIRLAWLEKQFPETAIVARADYESECRAMGEQA